MNDLNNLSDEQVRDRALDLAIASIKFPIQDNIIVVEVAKQFAEFIRPGSTSRYAHESGEGVVGRRAATSPGQEPQT